MPRYRVVSDGHWQITRRNFAASRIFTLMLHAIQPNDKGLALVGLVILASAL